ncbi:MAG: arginine--tRNA ligase [Candidatus Latescibacterota bacterium]|nr:MAG: arginine--tRNA ligase [Candidatus Latescibacterota bacterium]
MKEQIRAALESTLRDLQLEPPAQIQLDAPRDKRHGDLSSNVALILARASGLNPRALAARIVERLQERDDCGADVDLAGPGFINFRVHSSGVSAALRELLRTGVEVGRCDAGAGARVQLEFVSANPTGPLNVVSARAAAYGSTLAAMLSLCGYEVQSEFYVNDAGRQIELLGASVRARLTELRGGAQPVPEGGYQGDYVREIAAAIPGADADAWLALPDAESDAAFGAFAVERMVDSQRGNLARFGVRYDRWFRESELHGSDAVSEARDELERSGYVYERDGALFFRSTTWNDAKDRVLVRSDGTPTYFLADAAYHRNKHDRGFAKVINVWGPDHHGHIQRMQALARAFGYPEEWLEVVIVQQVNLVEGGEKVKMSKRAGQLITLAELMDEVGEDVARYFFLMRQHASHLDFDLDLARRQSDENPVYYVKYAYARICSIIRKAASSGLRLRAPELEGSGLDPGADAPLPQAAALERLEEPAERELVQQLVDYPGFVRRAAEAREPHRLTTYSEELARTFHRFYHEQRVIQEDRDLGLARLALCHATRRVLASALHLMAIEAPQSM